MGQWAPSILLAEVPAGESFATPPVAHSPSLQVSGEGSTVFFLAVVSLWTKLCYRGGDAIER